MTLKNAFLSTVVMFGILAALLSGLVGLVLVSAYLIANPTWYGWLLVAFMFVFIGFWSMEEGE